MYFQAPKRRYHRIDGWRGYVVQALAVVGASVTGSTYDSPCRPNDIGAELERFRKECLRPLGIRSRIGWGQTSNVFCGKRWVKVSRNDFARAAQAAIEWLEENERNTQYVHTADLEQLIMKGE